ncbi:MAG TPA: recombination mediator RecR [Verrucomicrobiae bacterium]|nr:recombination mediator RecR [Verrucomicrobiae bacterium]
MALLPEPITQLIAGLSQLPGVGPRSAERIALHIVQSDANGVAGLANSILSARSKVSLCQNCGGLTEKQPCAFCTDPRRDQTLICLVERPVDILSIEKSGVFRGLYHVLGGKISPLNGIEPEDLRIAELERRCASASIAELILALSSDVEGDATGYYLNKLFTARGIKVTRLAHGLAVGSGLEYADELTLSRALEGRRQF